MKTEKKEKYIDLISQSKENIEKEQLELDNEGALNQISQDLHAAKSKVVNKRRDLKVAKRQQPFNTANVIRIQRELALAQKDVADIEALKAELF